MKKCIFLFLFLWPYLLQASVIDTVNVTDEESSFVTYNKIAILEDKTNSLSFQEAQSAIFRVNYEEVPNLDLSKSTYWFRFSLINKTDLNKLLIHVAYPLLDSVTLFLKNEDGSLLKLQSGEKVELYKRQFRSQEIIFEIPVESDHAARIYLKIRSEGPKQVPIFVGTTKNILKSINRDDMIFSAYIGILGIMLLYNLFIFFSIRDKDYLLYVLYILTIAFTQLSIKGYGYRYLWHDFSFIIDQSIYLSGVSSGILTAVFTISFLKAKERLPFLYKFLKICIGLYIISLILSLSHFYSISFQLINSVALIGCFIVVISSVFLALKGFREAIYYSIALSFFLVSVIIFALESYGIIPYNLFTRNILLIGSAIEIALLSFALADKINVYRQENEHAQLEALRATRDKEEFVRKQNVILESKIQQRTADLQQANVSLRQVNINLSIAMENQKKAESKLVHAEKMASLGQLTAGIAHEINNPINFVKSNIKPLSRDITDLLHLILKYREISKDNIAEKLVEIEAFTREIDLEILKEEIPMLLSGIEEGAGRTAEIVRGLRIFSRVDENVLKKADIHSGIDSTLVLLNNIIPGHLIIEKEYDQLPLIDCYPGKLNQVFMNLLTNAIQAVNAKPEPENERIFIKTIKNPEHVEIHISDTGPGIPEDLQGKIFDPFFTTKVVGEGTGLGLSMSYSIIQEHGGEIKVISEVGKGTEFIITLPVSQDNVQRAAKAI